MSDRRAVVKITANFDRNLAQIRDFLAEVPRAFEALLERLESSLIPALEQFPDMGADFAARAPLSREGAILFERMAVLAAGGQLRQVLEGDYIILYLVREQEVYLLAVKHHRQLSFEFTAHWP